MSKGQMDLQKYDSLKRINNLDTRLFSNLEMTKLNELNNLVENESDYINKLYEISEPHIREMLMKPEFLMETLKTKNELKSETEKAENGNIFLINNLCEQRSVISRDKAIEAKFPVGGSNISSNDDVFAFQYLAYKEVNVDDDIKHLGYGLFITVESSNMSANANADFSFLAASATVSDNRFSYSARLLGITDIGAHKLLQDTLPGNKFDIESYAGYKKFKEKLIEGLESGEINIEPVYLEPVDLLQQADIDKSAFTRVYSLISIAKKKTLAEAIDDCAEEDDCYHKIIRTVYKKNAKMSKMNRKPKDKYVKKAKKALNNVGINI